MYSLGCPWGVVEDTSLSRGGSSHILALSSTRLACAFAVGEGGGRVVRVFMANSSKLELEWDALLEPGPPLLMLLWAPNGILLGLREDTSLLLSTSHVVEIKGKYSSTSPAQKYLESIGVSCLASQYRMGRIVVGTRTGCLYTWDNTTPTRTCLEGQVCDERLQSISLKRDRLVAVITQSGKAFMILLAQHRGSNMRVSKINSSSTQEAFSCASFSLETPTLALGMAHRPRISLFGYTLERAFDLKITHLRDLVLFGPSRIEEEMAFGAVRNVMFMEGYTVTALVHGSKTPVEWCSLTGRRLGGAHAQTWGNGTPSRATRLSSLGSASSLPSLQQQQQQQLASPNNRHQTQLPPLTSLCVRNFTQYFTTPDGKISIQKFARIGRTMALVSNPATRATLVGDEFFIYVCNPPHRTMWIRVDVPESYGEQNGPCRCLAVSEDGLKTAVSGARGFVWYSARSRKWKLFQNLTSEANVHVAGMFWLSNNILAVADSLHMEESSTTSPEYRWKLFDAVNDKLEVPFWTSPYVLPGKPIAADVCGSYVVVLYSSGLEYYEVTAMTMANDDGTNRGSTPPPSSSPTAVAAAPASAMDDDTDKILSKRSFLRRPSPAHLGYPINVFFLPRPNTTTTTTTTIPRCVVLDSVGKLVLADPISEDWVTTAIWPQVGDAWAKVDLALGAVVWMVVDGGICVWVPSLDPSGECSSSKGEEAISRDIVRAEVGSMPIGPHRALEDAMVSFEHFVDTHTGAGNVRCTISPSLHGLLAWLLRSKRDGLAKRVLAGRGITAWSSFVRAALEDLLHGALLDVLDLHVDRVVPLLGCVPFQVLAVVATRCARQIDPVFWGDLFAVVGNDVRELFNQTLACFDDTRDVKMLHVAAELLPIVDASQDDPQDGPTLRANKVLRRCEPNSALEREIREYARKRLLPVDLNANLPSPPRVSDKLWGGGGVREDGTLLHTASSQHMVENGHDMDGGGGVERNLVSPGGFLSRLFPWM